ncbi:NUDIX domain-containing protein [Halomicrobium mukohataei]|uniref:NUDIX domain-containing protein n=1 Tax=Halomicrobium mukohataei TaxID=57705 RepID=A0A847UF82_9EURY|nr:NUDIX hydrolase [Halomicrobium mukohataei]NLV09771.1 NUDIX domain-containing protein [Halomicrobium mukohataei]
MTDELAWETLERSVAYSCEGFDVRNERVRFPDGTDAEFDYLAEGESVVVLPLTPDGDVVVIEEWRQAVGRVNRGLPAGSMESDDAEPADAARRELAEETGYEAGSLEHLTTVEPANGFADAVFHYFVARDCEQTVQQDLDDNESIRVATTTLDELLDAAREDELRDGRTVTGVLYYALFEQ